MADLVTLRALCWYMCDDAYFFFFSQGGLPLVSIFVWFMTEVNGSTDFFPSMSAILVWFFMILIIIFSFLLLLLWIVVLYSRVELFTSLRDRNRRVIFTGLSFPSFCVLETCWYVVECTVVSLGGSRKTAGIWRIATIHQMSCYFYEPLFPSVPYAFSNKMSLALSVLLLSLVVIVLCFWLISCSFSIDSGPWVFTHDTNDQHQPAPFFFFL